MSRSRPGFPGTYSGQWRRSKSWHGQMFELLGGGIIAPAAERKKHRAAETPRPTHRSLLWTLLSSSTFKKSTRCLT